MSQSQPSSTAVFSRGMMRMSWSRRVLMSMLQPTGQVGQTLGVCSRSHGRARKRYDLLVSAPTGQMSVVLPEKTESNGRPGKIPISVLSPRLIMTSCGSSAMSFMNRTQSWHMMQRSRSSTICGPICRRFWKRRFSSTKRVTPGPNLKVRFCKGHSPPLSQMGQSSGWLISSSSSMPRRAFSTASDLVVTTMPGATGVAHAGGKPFCFSMATRHMRHAPSGSILLW